MKTVFYLIACSFCAACCLFAETTEQPFAAESNETVACIKCNRPACGGCGKLACNKCGCGTFACNKCKSLFLVNEDNQLAENSQDKEAINLAGCPCKGKGKKTSEVLFNQTDESVLA